MKLNFLSRLTRMRNNNMKKNIISLTSLLLLISLGPINAVLYTPALPMLAKYYRVSQGSIQDAVGVFMLAML